MSINIISTIENFKSDTAKVYDKYVNKGNKFELNDLEMSLVLRVAGIASAILGALAIGGTLSLIACCPISAVVLGCFGASILVMGHDAIKIGDNISQQLNLSIGKIAINAALNILKKILTTLDSLEHNFQPAQSASHKPPAIFQGTIINYSTYEAVAKKLHETFC
jgi:hypothetical protein